jgi:predicted nuclease of restriction endonuclease-like (RecB) superfamily
MLDNAYKDWLIELKQKVRTAQLKAAVAVNTELIILYWELGKMITEKQTAWGSKFLEQLSQDLRTEFPDMQGFSERNLKYCRQFYQFYIPSIEQQLVAQLKQANQTNDTSQIVSPENFITVFRQQPVAQIPWGHNILIFSKSKSADEAEFYASQTLQNGWSRNILSQQINANLFQRQGKAIHNFQNTLPEITSDLAHQMIKDPYQFDFLALTDNYKERELENALVNNITNFLLELGSGFAYIGRQVPLMIGDQEYFIDLLFYHLKLRAYVVVELKTTDFIPEYAGKLSFYLSAANDLLKHSTDNPTIGLMICKNKNNIIAEYALKDINQPIGVSEYQLSKLFPEEFKSSLPTIEEIEKELSSDL